MRTFYRDEENPYDYTTNVTQTVYRDEEKDPIPSFMEPSLMDAPSTNKVNWDGGKSTYVGNLDRSLTTGASASNNMKISSTTEHIQPQDFGALTYSVQKSIRVSFGGTIRVIFDTKDTSNLGGAARIYVNDAAVGTVRQGGTSYTTFTEDITISASDRVQLYSQHGGGVVTAVRNMIISFDRTVDGDGVILTD